jgi:ankyrin repeat protein
MEAGPASSSIVAMLVQHAHKRASFAACIDSRCLQGVTVAHLLACWTPENDNHSSSSSSSSSSSGTAAAAEDTRSDKPNSSSSKNAAQPSARTAEQQQQMRQHLAALELLLEQCTITTLTTVDVEAAASYTGDTPLTFAAFAGAVDVARMLLLNGADANLPREGDAARPIDIAARAGQYGLACLLLEHGAEVSWPGQFVVRQ